MSQPAARVVSLRLSLIVAAVLAMNALCGCKDDEDKGKRSDWTSKTYARVSEADVRALRRQTAPPADPEPVSDPATPPAKKAAVLAIVIDDVGLRRNALDPFLAIRGLRGMLTWALLPKAPHTVALGRELLTLNESIILHMPMEPQNPSNIAPHLGSYLRQMQTPRQIRAAVIDAFSTFPDDIRERILGLNNHQGSNLTSSEEHMLAVAETVRERGGFILDSKTSKASVLAEAASKLGIPARSRDVFLDNIRSQQAIEEQLNIAADIALKSGSAIAIGHPYPETALAIASWLRSTQLDIQLVALKDLMKRPQENSLDASE